MHEFQFCYWLQGLFEILHPEHLDTNQVNCIKQHLELVEHKNGQFCNWFEGFIDSRGIEPWNNSTISKVQERLSNEFRTIIDPSYPPEIQEQLYTAHRGDKKPTYPGLEVLC